jgi:hypothetical protein
MGHPDCAIARFVDQREPPDAVIVARMPQPDLVEESAIDLVHDLQMPRQDASKQAD